MVYVLPLLCSGKLICRDDVVFCLGDKCMTLGEGVCVYSMRAQAAAA